MTNGAGGVLRILRFLAAQPHPLPASRIAAAVGLPRSTVYRLLATLRAEGFVVHLADDRAWGLGVTAYEVGSGYTRQAPLQRLARQSMARLVDTVGESAHLAVLYGRDVVYVIEERATGRPSLVTDVGVRLPAHLTASGRAMLAALPPAQVRALFPDRSAFVHRADAGPATPSALRAVLAETRQRGHAREDGEITPGFASVAAAVLDHNGHPVASVAVTYPGDTLVDPDDLARPVISTAAALSRRLGAP